jgi:hypothetical protein
MILTILIFLLHPIEGEKLKYQMIALEMKFLVVTEKKKLIIGLMKIHGLTMIKFKTTKFKTTKFRTI